MTSLGLETFYQLALPILKVKQDCIVIALHAKLLSHGFLCLHSAQVQQEELDVRNAKTSELLPDRWNLNSDVYELRYMKDGQQLYVKAIADDTFGALIITVVRVSDEQAQSLTLNIDQWISDDFHAYERAYKDRAGLCESIERNLILPFILQQKPSGSAYGSATRQPPSPEPEQNIPRPGPGREIPFPDPFAVGAGDLNPLAGGRGGGMLMDPRHQRPQIQPGIPGNLPPGAVPPGARFDPFGPPPPEQIGRPRPQPRGGFGDPDPNHLPPPGYYDPFL